MANMDILNALAAQSATVKPSAELKSFEEDEDERTSQALKALIEQVPSSVMDAGRAPSAEKKPEVSAKTTAVTKPKVVPKYDPDAEERKSFLENLNKLESQVQEAITKGGLSTKGKTTEEISKQVSEGTKQRPTLTEEQANIDLLQSQIDSLEGEKKKKKQEVESYLDQAIADIAKKPEGMGLLEIVGKSMIALAPGIIGAKVAGYRGGQYAQEGATKAIQSLMETEETRRQAAQKIQAEMSKVRASLSKDDMDNIAALQKELIKGQIDLRTLPLKNQLELTRLLSAKELTKDQSLDLAGLLVKISELKLKATEQRTAPKAGAGAGAGKPSKAQEIIDKEFGKQYSEFMDSGGFAKYATQVEQLKSGIKDMKGSDFVSGPAISLLPERLRPLGSKVQNEVLAASGGMLREVLGGNFAAREGEGIQKRLFNPEAEEAVNIQAAERFLNQISRAKEIKEDQIAYFEKYGTLAGWPGLAKLRQIEAEMTAGSEATQGLDASRAKRLEEINKRIKELESKKAGAK